MNIMTYGDFFAMKFGKRPEAISVALNIPIYVGWIAVQIVALANILQVFFPAPLWVYILGIALFTAYLTTSGGLWSVSITDSFQIFIIIMGLIYLLLKVSDSAGGMNLLLSEVPDEKLVVVPYAKLGELFSWFGVFCISALGNLTGQDLGQRIFSAKSASVAKKGCILAGVGYLTIGSIPVFLGVTAESTVGISEQSVIPRLIESYLDPISSIVLILTIISAVVSTITSALLAPASLVSRNFLKEKFPEQSTLSLCRYSVIFVAFLSVATALAGENTYTLLEESYAIGFVGFFAPVTIGLFSKRLDEKSCLIAMISGISIWALGLIFPSDYPTSLIAVVLSYLAYFVSYRIFIDHAPANNLKGN
jgi:Na+/proline symporter